MTMKISNFRNFREWTLPGIIVKDRYEAATVDVTTGILWWKKTKQMEVMRKWPEYWKFMDTGEFTPDYLVENLASAYKMRRAAEGR